MIFDIPISVGFPIGFFAALIPMFVKLGMGAAAASTASTMVMSSLIGGGIQAARGKNIGKGMLMGAGGGLLFAPMLGAGAGAAGATAGAGTGAAAAVAPVIGTGTVPAGFIAGTHAGAAGAAAGAAAPGAAAAKLGMGAAMKKGAASALGSAMIGQGMAAMQPDQISTMPLGDQLGPPDFSAIQQLQQMAAQSKRTPWWLTQVGGDIV